MATIYSPALKENDGGTYLDKITEFSIRPPEVLSRIDQIGNYFRWFVIDSKSQKIDTI